jgi:hypothetical protein
MIACELVGGLAGPLDNAGPDPPTAEAACKVNCSKVSGLQIQQREAKGVSGSHPVFMDQAQASETHAYDMVSCLAPALVKHYKRKTGCGRS